MFYEATVGSQGSSTEEPQTVAVGKLDGVGPVDNRPSTD